jgi:hypothetical protein
MARRIKKNGNADADSTKSVERQRGVNVLTDTTYGVYVEGAEETIDMYERGEISREDLYQSILDLDVVYRSTDQKSVESEVE